MKSRLLYPFLVTCLLVAFVACRMTVANATEQPTNLVLAEALPKIVKLYGAGGFRGLEGYGTGILVSSDGFVVTSWGSLLDTEQLTAVLSDGRRVEARLVGADPGLGIAVLKLDRPDLALPHFDLVEAVDLAPGDRVYALSNMFRVAAGDEPVSVMHGMILAKAPLNARRGRFQASLESPVYHLDAVTNNPGAAGGAIISLGGNIVGLIGRELRGEDSETWINYAVPVTLIAERIRPVLEGADLVTQSPANADAALTTRQPVELGLVMIPDVTARTPAFVSDVLDGTVAGSAGFLREDLVLFANGAPVRSIREFSILLSKAERGDEMSVIVRRAGQLVSLTFIIP